MSKSLTEALEKPGVQPPVEYRVRAANAIQAHDSTGNMVMINNPKPSRIFRIVDLGNKDDHKVKFLGWGED